MEYLNDLVDFIVIQAATEIAAKNKRRRLEELKKQQNLQLNKSVGQPGQPGQPSFNSSRGLRCCYQITGLSENG